MRAYIFLGILGVAEHVDVFGLGVLGGLRDAEFDELALVLGQREGDEEAPENRARCVVAHHGGAGARLEGLGGFTNDLDAVAVDLEEGAVEDVGVDEVVDGGEVARLVAVTGVVDTTGLEPQVAQHGPRESEVLGVGIALLGFVGVQVEGHAVVRVTDEVGVELQLGTGIDVDVNQGRVACWHGWHRGLVVDFWSTPSIGVVGAHRWVNS